MGLDIWFAEDIRNALLAANEASAATATAIAEAVGLLPAGLEQAVTDSAELLAVSLQAYREGYKAALATVALAFGIAPQTIILRQPLDVAQEKTLRPAQEKTLRQTRDRPLDELRTMQAQDSTLRIEPQYEIPQPGGIPEVTYLSSKVGGS